MKERLSTGCHFGKKMGNTARGRRQVIANPQAWFNRFPFWVGLDLFVYGFFLMVLTGFGYMIYQFAVMLGF